MILFAININQPSELNINLFVISIPNLLNEFEVHYPDEV